jgi:FkbM family methyltransferase
MFETDDCNVAHFKVSVIKDDEWIGRCLKSGHEWDGWMRQDLPHIYKPGTDLLDIGGNIGYNALMYSDYGPVHTFDPLFHPIISKNVNQNQLRNPITVHPYGLSSKECRAEIAVPWRGQDGLCNYGGTSLKGFENSIHRQEIDLKRLDDVYDGIPSVMKLDIEGHEFEALKGAERTIASHRPAMYIEWFEPMRDSEIHNFLKKYGYDIIIERPEHNWLLLSTCQTSQK